MDLFNQEVFRFPVQNYLVNRDSKGSLRVVSLSCAWDEEAHGFCIKRFTGIYGKKQIEQPDVFIKIGKAKRSVSEQAELQYKHMLKEYRDKGYKDLDNDPEKYTLEDLSKIAGEYKTSQNGTIKPMLAKPYSDITKTEIFNKTYYGSRKINGVRALLYWDGSNICTSSRGSISYDLVMDHIITHPLLIKLFQANPTLILDGEIYKHGWTLNKISGICRSQKTAYDGEPLEFYLYDIADLNMSFAERVAKLNKIKKLLNLSFDPEREWKEDELKIQLVPQELISGLDNMMQLHNKYVSEGWEGLVIRLASAKYGPGKRTNDMIKIKEYKDSTYRCIGIEQGLRMYDDMVFIMETKDGQEFRAKPYGDHDQKVEYTENFEKDYKGHMGDVKYFEISPYGVPQQPTFISFRFDLD